MEQWMAVVGFEGLYEVSSTGRVKSLARTDSIGRPVHERILRQNVNGAGYLSVDLFRDGARSMSLVHRLVAQAFVANPSGLPQVNHIDGSRDNNRDINLEWISPRGNVIHAMHKLGRERGPNARRPVEALRHGEVVFSLESTQAARTHGFDPSHISRCCRTHRPGYGLDWRYTAPTGHQSARR